jgi:hypothetical protein
MHDRRRRGALARTLRAGVLVLSTAMVTGTVAGGAGDDEVGPGTGGGLVLVSASVPIAPSNLVQPHGGGFLISGSVGGLYPGAELPLHLTVLNPHSFAISVRSISVRVTSTAAACPAAYLHAGDFLGQLTVRGLGTAHTTVPVTLIHSAPDGCQGVLFTLSYSGTAVKPQ